VAAGDEPQRVHAANLDHIAVVAIGRNEGERLRRCLRSLPQGLGAVVYVDSGSTDGSVEFARGQGAEVVELDMTIPFTAARARNAGIERARRLRPELRFVQVIDGDCELVEGFIESAHEAIERDATIGVVCGRRRELHPEASPYNRLCDMEWNTSVGEADSCGGDALLRLAAFDAAGGYDPRLIAGEEPDMCFRMRKAGYRVLRIQHEMTRHDAAILHFAQWWKRNLRAGHAGAEGLSRRPEDAYARRSVRSNYVYGLFVPGFALLLALPSRGASLLVLALYAVSFARNRRHRIVDHGDGASDANLYSVYTVLGKIPQAFGVLQFHWNRLRGRRTQLIEYKGA
jgi:glycosyltransferase involved in cell wall biosynthesis